MTWLEQTSTPICCLYTLIRSFESVPCHSESLSALSGRHYEDGVKISSVEWKLVGSLERFESSVVGDFPSRLGQLHTHDCH
jgi:hypothetical protein